MMFFILDFLRWVREQYEFEAEKSLKQLASFLVTLKNDHGFTGEFNTFDYKWTAPNSILFTMTTLTMIGYGVIAPRTASGESDFKYTSYFALEETCS